MADGPSSTVTPPHMASLSPSALQHTALTAARAAATIIREAASRRPDLVWQEKATADFATVVDLSAEACITDLVRAAYPGARILAEESAGQGTQHAPTEDLVFVVDPLDGTANFLHGLPGYAVSIGVLVEGEVEAGVILDVRGNGEFTATRGGGSWRNGTRLSVAATREPTRALVGVGLPAMGALDASRTQAPLGRLIARAQSVRLLGAAAIDFAHVAMGQLDAYWHPWLAPWDLAAGILLVREAGGIVTDLSGAPCPVAHTGVLAGNSAMHGWLAATLAG